MIGLRSRPSGSPSRRARALRHAGGLLAALVLGPVGPAANAVAGDVGASTADLLRDQGLRLEQVFSGTEIGAASFDLSRFSGPGSVDALLGRLRLAWQQDDRPVMQSSRGAWQTLTRQRGAGVETVEVRGRPDGLEGRLIRSRAGSPPAQDPSAGWLAGAGSDVEQPDPAVTHRDAGRVLTTRVGYTGASIAAAAAGLRRALHQAGFHESTTALPGLAGPGGSVAVLARGDEEVAFTVSDNGRQRAVVLHWGRRP